LQGGAVSQERRRPREDVVNEQAPLPYGEAGPALVRCVVSTADLLTHRRIRLPSEHVGLRLRFADGTSARVYRETVVDGGPPAEPCALVVGFRLRFVRGWGHTLFRRESLLNTPLFVGFPGFVSKLWLAHDERGRYRGVYEWDGPERAESYARSLWRVLALGSVPGSIRYVVLPGVRRDALLPAPHPAEATAPGDAAAWWRPVGAA
jgi:hypothetical protein